MSLLRAAGSHTLKASGPFALRPRLSTGLPLLSYVSIIPPTQYILSTLSNKDLNMYRGIFRC